MRKWQIYLFVIILMVSSDAFSQTIKGKIINDENIGIKNTTIALLGSDSSLVSYDITDTIGNFSLLIKKTGDYNLKISHIGYQSVYLIVHAFKDSTILLSPVKMNLFERKLQEVLIKSQKQVLERKIDRLIFNIENSSLATGNSLYDALIYTPMLKVSENGLSVIGKGGVTVMINDRQIFLHGQDLMNYLKSLRSDNISKIEIITTPPAKYDAQGNGGIVNIILKRNPNMGWSGNITSTYSQRSLPLFAEGFTLNYLSNKISSTVMLRYFNNQNRIIEQNNLIGDNSILNYSPRRGSTTNYGGRWAFDYKMSKMTNLGFIVDVSNSISNTKTPRITTYLSEDAVDSTLSTLTFTKDKTPTATMNVYVDQKLDSQGKKISTSLNYFTNQPRTFNDLNTQNQEVGTDMIVKNNSFSNLKILSSQIDVTLPYRWAKIETGIKYTNFTNHSNVDYLNLIKNDYVLDSSKTDSYFYSEKNYAAYVSAEKELNEFSAKAGLRFEQTSIDGISYSTSINTSNRYGSFFPTVFLSYKPSANNNFTLSLSRRISRPNLRFLNPFRLYVNPYNYYTGNPLLRPSYSNNIELSYLYKGYLSITAYAQFNNKLFNSVTETQNDVIITTVKNYLNTNNYGVNITYSKKFFVWWDNSSYVSASYSNSSSLLNNIATNNGYTIVYGLNNLFTVNKWLKMFANFTHNLPSKGGNSYNYTQLNFNPGARFLLLSNKLTISVSGLLASVNKAKYFYDNFTNYLRTDYNYRTLNLVVTYVFGKSKVKSNSKKADFKESQRAN